MMAYWRLPTTGVAGGLYQRVEEDTASEMEMEEEKDCPNILVLWYANGRFVVGFWTLDSICRLLLLRSWDGRWFSGTIRYLWP